VTAISDAAAPVDAPSRTFRVLIGLLAGAWGGTLTFAFFSRRGFYGDFLAFWYAARAWLSGLDPYAVTPSAAPYLVDDRFFYPLPSVIAITPFAGLPLAVAAAAFFGLSSSLLGYALARDRWDRLALFLSFPYVMAASLGQWSPLVMAAALLPGAGFLSVLKPNLGLALTFARPSRSALVGGPLLLVASLTLDPSWPLKWLANLRSMEGHPPALLTIWGCWLGLAALRWRREDARLVLGMAAIPQLPMFYDQLPLLMVQRNRRYAIAAALLSHVGGLLWLATQQPGRHPSANALPWVTLFVYLPAFVVLLRGNRSPRSRPVPVASSEST
jgi:hypothetical protein